MGPMGFNSFDGGDDEDDDCTRYYKNIKDGKSNRRYSGAGILEFSPQKAGLDVTPANFDFSSNTKPERTRSGTLNSLSGNHIHSSIASPNLNQYHLLICLLFKEWSIN